MPRQPRRTGKARGTSGRDGLAGGITNRDALEYQKRNAPGAQGRRQMADLRNLRPVGVRRGEIGNNMSARKSEKLI